MPKIEHTRHDMENGDVVFGVNNDFFLVSKADVPRIGETELLDMFLFHGWPDEPSSAESPFTAWFPKDLDTGEEFFCCG